MRTSIYLTRDSRLVTFNYPGISIKKLPCGDDSNLWQGTEDFQKAAEPEAQADSSRRGSGASAASRPSMQASSRCAQGNSGTPARLESTGMVSGGMGGGVHDFQVSRTPSTSLEAIDSV
jgi:hypothetical protein